MVLILSSNSIHRSNRISFQNYDYWIEKSDERIPSSKISYSFLALRALTNRKQAGRTSLVPRPLPAAIIIKVFVKMATGSGLGTKLWQDALRSTILAHGRLSGSVRTSRARHVHSVHMKFRQRTDSEPPLTNVPLTASLSSIIRIRELFCESSFGVCSLYGLSWAP